MRTYAVWLLAASLLSQLSSLVSAAAQTTVESLIKKPVIVLTYPAVVTDDAAAAIQKDFMQARWPDSCSDFLSGDVCDHNDEALSEAVAKTLYYLPDAVAAVEKVFPDATIVPMPARLSRGQGGGLIYQSSDPELPAALRIDFMTHVSTRTVSSGPSYSSTNGLFVVPVFVVWSGASKFKETGGLVATNKGIGPTVPNLATHQPSALLHLLAKGRKVKDKTAHTAEMLDARQYKLTDEEWSKLKANSQGGLVAERIFEENLKPVAARVAEADLQTTPSELTAYEKLYPPLVTRPEALGPAAEFAAAEAEFMRDESAQTVGQLRGSDFDKSMSILIAAEREHNKKAERMSWIAALTIVGSGFLNSAKGGSFAMGELQQMPSYETQMQQVQSAFSENFAPVSARQYSVAVRMGGKESQLQARSVAELRQELAGTIAGQSSSPVQAAVMDKPASTNAPLSVADELGKLADLRHRRVITDAEFQAAKEKLLGSVITTPTRAATAVGGVLVNAGAKGSNPKVALDVTKLPERRNGGHPADHIGDAAPSAPADSGALKHVDSTAPQNPSRPAEAAYQRKLAEWQAEMDQNRQANEEYGRKKAEVARQTADHVQQAKQEHADWERRVAACKAGDYSQCATQGSPQ